MIKAKLAIALVAIGWALALAAATASAEFTSQNKESKGSAEVAEMTLQAGGATVLCQALEESQSKGTWLLKKGSEATTLGPDLVLDVGKWGSCTGSSSEIKETKAEINACSLEVVEPAEETTVKGKLVTECTIKFASCELKLEPKENEKLTSVLLYADGTEDENVFADPEVDDIATTIKGTCTGIKESKEGKLKGELEAQQVQPAARGEFTLSSSRAFLFTGSVSADIRVRRRSGFTAKPKQQVRSLPFPNPFSSQAPNWEECTKSMVYAVGGSCEFEVSYEPTVGIGTYNQIIWGENDIASQVLVRGR
jgi:hypothetical protein